MKAIPFRGVVTSLLSFVLLALISTSVSLAQTATLSGVITDADNGDPLTGASVVLFPLGEVSMAGGAASDLQGRYNVTGLLAGQYTVRITFVGYNEFSQVVTLNTGEARTLNFQLSQGGFDLNTVVVTASRRQEKALDAPASISVLDADEVQSDMSLSSAGALRNTTGLDVAQTGIDRREIVLRGFNNAFSGATYVLTDYRQSAAPSLGVNIYSIMPNMAIDIDRIEVVRGPGSALYGAGVDAGVVHFLTKDPFQHPGTTISLIGGERSMFGFEARHAGVVNDNFGYKITAAYGQADDWRLNPSDSLDMAQLDNDHEYAPSEIANVPDNQILNSAGKIQRNYDYQKVNVNGTAVYKSGLTMFTLSGGISRYDATVLSGIGTLQADNFGYSYGQLRVQNGKFFGQIYLNKNAAGDSFVYGTGENVVDNSTQVNVQAQYNVDISKGQHNIIFGGDLEVTQPETEGTILGRNEQDDRITELGFYSQGAFNLSEQLTLTAAIRGDYNTVIESFQASPRGALVYKPMQGHSFRASYNRAFSSPGVNSLFLDIVAAELPGGITLRGLGSAKGWSWNRDPNWEALFGSDLVATSLNPATLGAPQPVGLPLDAIYNSVYAGLAAIPNANLVAILAQNGITVDEPTAGGLKALLAPAATQVGGFSQGQLALLNTTTGRFDPTGTSSAVDIAPLSPTTTNTFELGYNGIFNNKVLFAVDAYYTNKSNFVGPLRMESPFVLVPTLSTDLIVALTQAITNNTILAGQLELLGVPPQNVAGLLVGLAAGSLPSAQTPVAIVEAMENAVGIGNAPEAFLSYRNFGTVDYLGADLSVQVLVSDELSLFGNMSFVSDDFFDAEELGEAESSGLKLALNAPRAKFKLGARYSKRNSVSAGFSARFTDGFPILSGPYVGDLPSYFLVDLNLGYDFGTVVDGLRLDAGIQNVLDDRHREFIGSALLGRVGMARLTYSFR